MKKIEPIVLDYASQPSHPGNLSGIVSSVLIAAAALILIGLVLTPSFISVRPGAEKGLARMAISADGPIVAAINAFKLHTGHLPAALQYLSDKPAGESKWLGPYIEDPSKLVDPWGETYQYQCPGKNSRPYDLWSKGPDKISGTIDDIGP